MIATVAYWELRLAGRRRRQHVLRWCYLGWLALLLMGWITQGPVSPGRLPLAVQLIDSVLLLQLFLIAALTPALTASVVADARTRGVLPQLVTTDLWPSDILLGKLLARLAEVALLLLTGLPVLAGLGVFAGLGPVLMLLLVWLAVPPLLGLGAAGLLASVLARTTRDAVVGIYLAGLILAAVVWQFWPGLGAALSPLEVLRPALERSQYQASAGRLLVYSLGWLMLGAACLATALLRFPRIWQRPFEQRRRAERTAIPLRADEAPVPWKEQHIHGLTPLPGRGAGVLLTALLSLAGAGAVLWWARPTPKSPRRLEVFFPVDAHKAEDGFLLLAAVGLLAATLVVGARASAAVSGEREAGTWDSLLVSPLEPHQLLRGKLHGIWRAALPYLAAFALPLLALSLLGGGVACFWALLLMGLTPLAMYYLGAAGIYCSVTCPDSTRSLAWTLAYGYVGASLIYLFASLVTAVLTGIVHMFLTALGEYHGIRLRLALAGKSGELGAAVLIGSCLAMALAFFLAAHALLKRAEFRLADRERVRQEEPRRSRGPRIEDRGSK